MPNILESANKEAVKAALDQVAHDTPMEGSVEVTSDGRLEGSVDADKWHTHFTGYVSKKLTGAKEFVGGLRASWKFGKK